jgi:sugar phosphate isomerase/epimerase
MVKFQIGCLSNAFLFWPMEKALQAMSRIGCKCVEIMCERPHVHPDDWDSSKRKLLKKMCEDLGLRVSVLDSIHVSSLAGLCAAKKRNAPSFFPDGVSYEPTFTSVPKELRRARIEYTKKCIDLAAEMGVDKVETYSGDVSCHPDDAWRYAIEGLTECVEYAAKNRVHLLLELFDALIVGTPDDALRAIREIGSPWLGLSVDIGHLDIAYRNIPDTIKKLGGHIKQVHIEDMKMQKHFHLICGRGNIDFRACLSALKAIDYDGSVCLELYPYADNPEPAVQESILYLNRLVEQI